MPEWQGITSAQNRRSTKHETQNAKSKSKAPKKPRTDQKPLAIARSPALAHNRKIAVKLAMLNRRPFACFGYC